MMRRHRRSALWSALFLAFVLLPASGVTEPMSEYSNRFTWVTIGGVRVKAEVVDTPDKIYLGLGYRLDLPEGRGMLFAMPAEEHQQFCMRGMQFAIDIIWIGRGQVVGIEGDVQPGETRALESPEPVRYVLEVKGGFCQRHGVKVGDRAEFKL